jgi:hypothetical protein
MNLPNLPGFTAEASVDQKIGRQYLGVATGGEDAGQVVPQMCHYVPIVHTVVRDCGAIPCPAHPGYELEIRWRLIGCWGD